MVFHKKRLDQGERCPLDCAVTRTGAGSANESLLWHVRLTSCTVRVLAFLKDKVKHILKILLVQGLGVIFHLEKKKNV